VAKRFGVTKTFLQRLKPSSLSSFAPGRKPRLLKRKASGVFAWELALKNLRPEGLSYRTAYKNEKPTCRLSGTWASKLKLQKELRSESTSGQMSAADSNSRLPRYNNRSGKSCACF
jgi:hypothetical protein